MALVKILLATKDPDILPEHIRNCLDTLLWKITEADGKHNTRYKTEGALRCSNKSQLEHEHVYQKASMIDALLKATPETVESILNDAVGCLVTKDEHERLKKFSSDYGWDRYRKAGIEVIDMITGERKV